MKYKFYFDFHYVYKNKQMYYNTLINILYLHKDLYLRSCC